MGSQFWTEGDSDTEEESDYEDEVENQLVLPFQLTETLLVLTESNERAVEASIGGGELDLPIMRRENQDYADGITSIGATRGTSRSDQLRGAGGYSGRIAPSVKGSEMDASSAMVSLNHGVRA
ncbi:hypothetical protein SLE2022_064020 [Rubroshorea leprosula]